MKVVVLSYSGGVGKTTIAVNLLLPRVENARLFSVETINDSASELGVDTETMRGEEVYRLYRSVLLEDAAVVDVGASNVEAFLDRVMEFDGAKEEMDLFIVPVTPGMKQQNEARSLIQALAEMKVPAEKIRVVPNAIEREPAEECNLIAEFCETFKQARFKPEWAIYQNDVYDLLSRKQTTVQAVVADETDYRGMIRGLDRTKDAAKMQEYADKHVLRSLAVGVEKRLDAVFKDLVA